MDHSIALNINLHHIKPSPTLTINQRSKQLIAEGKTIYRFGFGASPFPVPDLVVQTLQKFACKNQYLPVQGLPELRQAVAKYQTEKLNLQFDKNDVMIGPGSKQLLFCLKLAYDGDILIPSPSWVSYQPQALILGKNILKIPTIQENKWKITGKQIEKVCQQSPNPHKLLIMNYPNNPTGQSFSEQELKQLTITFRKYKILVLADQIYRQVSFQSKKSAISLSQFYPQGTIISQGLSKWCGAGGWRLGCFTFPKQYEWLRKAMCAIASETFSAVSSPIQYAAIQAFQRSNCILKYIQNESKILKIVANYTFQELKKVNITCPQAQGGFYLFPNFQYYRTKLQKKSIKTSIQLCEKLLEEIGVALLPGTAFGRQQTEFTARLSYVDFNGCQILKLVQKIEQNDDFTKCVLSNIPKIVQGLQKLVDWCSK